MKHPRALPSLLFCFLFLGAGALRAEAPLAPAEMKGKVVYIPFPVTIALDGKLDDWAGIPRQTVDRGPSTSKDPAKNGSFQFALAADSENLYVLMLAKDDNIIANKHEADTWNEDSLEFYINLGKDLYAKKYSRDIVQYRVSPGDIDNADLSKVHVSGNNFDLYPLRAKVFRTSDGWGFEGAVKIGPKSAPAHGREIGFQAQLNGASVLDRDVKLIWSEADGSDNSWRNPSLFGRALFFKVGSSDVPMPGDKPSEPAPVAAPDPAAPLLSMNQVGYFPYGRKLASLSRYDFESLPWSLADANTKEKVASGMTSPGAFDLLSGDTLHVADFSSFTEPGEYYLTIGGVQGPVFLIDDDIMGRLSIDSLKYFYRSRSGIELKPEFAGTAWAREAGHLSDAKIAVFEGIDAEGKKWEGYDYFVNGSGGLVRRGGLREIRGQRGHLCLDPSERLRRNPGRFKDGRSPSRRAATAAPTSWTRLAGSSSSC